MLIAVISDTHIPSRAADLPDSAWAVVDQAQAVVHAGDVTAPEFLERLAARVPLTTVRGNNDHALQHLPERTEVDFERVRIGVVHDSGPTAGRRERLRRMFPQARVAIYGHSHIPVLDDDHSLLLLNPGSPTDRRRMPTFTMALLRVSEGALQSAQIIDLGLDRAVPRRTR